MIDLRRLEILRELARCGTVGATAVAVHLTPSAVSQQLAALSREAGTPMLEPDGRRVRLTPAAQLLLSHAHQVFTHLEHAESDLAAFRQGHAGTVRFGSFPSGIAALGVPLIRRLADRSSLTVQVREVQSDQAPDALLARTVDVSLGQNSGQRLPEDDDPRLAGEHLLEDVLDLVLPRDHPLADRNPVDLADAATEQWIFTPPGLHCWQVGMRSCSAAGFGPRVRHYADDLSGLIALVAAGQGVGFLPRLAQPSVPAGAYVIRPVCGPTPARQIFVRYRAGTGSQPHIAPVLAALREIAAELTARPVALASAS